MPVIEPIGFRILKDLKTCLQAIQQTTGFYHSVSPGGVRIDPEVHEDTVLAPEGYRPFLILQSFSERRTYQQADQLRIVQPVRLHWTDTVDPTDDEARLRVFWRACADIERALRPNGDGSRGGLAVETTVISQELLSFEGDVTRVYVAVDLEVPYYRTFGSPITQP